MMNWTAYLRESAKTSYGVTRSLSQRVDGAALDWKPETGTNWMTTGQLLRHIADGCGIVARGFVTGNWDFGDAAPDADPSGESAEGMMMPAEKMPSVDSLADFRTRLDADEAMFEAMLAEAGDRIDTEKVAAPWNPEPKLLAQQLHDCVLHLESHKAQLFYYLKLQGVDVNTQDLWGV